MGLFIIVAGTNIVEGNRNVKPGILTNDFTIEDGVVRENIGLSLYNDKFVEYNETMEAEKAALKAIEYCIDNGVMADFFIRKKAECMGSILRDYSEEEIWKMIGNDYYEDGFKDGTERGIERGIKSTVEAYKECDIPKETIIMEIAEKYSLSEEEAAAKVAEYL